MELQVFDLLNLILISHLITLFLPYLAAMAEYKWQVDDGLQMLATYVTY